MNDRVMQISILEWEYAMKLVFFIPKNGFSDVKLYYTFWGKFHGETGLKPSDKCILNIKKNANRGIEFYWMTNLAQLALRIENFLQRKGVCDQRKLSCGAAGVTL